MAQIKARRISAQSDIKEKVFMTETLPKTIGRYRIEKILGKGAMGVVYLGHDDMIDRKVAIKSIRLDKISSDEEKKHSVDMFFQEAKIIGKLDHSHITYIFDMGMEQDNPFIVMEYVTGKTIKDLINSKEKVSLENILKLVSMIATSMNYAHQRGVLHRDIKPANIMIMPKISPKIMDFGIAKISESTDKQVGEEGVVLGTPHYMSPEQIRGQEVDQRTDIFSLAVLTYEWIAREKPFNGQTLKEVIRGVVKNNPKPLSEISEADKELERIINKGMAKDKDERFANAEEFSDAIEIYLSKKDKKREVENPNASGTFSFNQLKIIDQLRNNYLFFKGFTEEELFNIFRLSNRERYVEGEIIIQEGTSGAKMYVILKGSVSIRKEIDGKEIEVKQLSAGECFGEMAIIDKHPRSASVIALQKTGVIAINEAVLRQSNPTLCLKLYRSLAAMISDKLRESDQKYYNSISND